MLPYIAVRGFHYTLSDIYPSDTENYLRDAHIRRFRTVPLGLKLGFKYIPSGNIKYNSPENYLFVANIFRLLIF